MPAIEGSLARRRRTALPSERTQHVAPTEHAPARNPQARAGGGAVAYRPAAAAAAGAASFDRVRERAARQLRQAQMRQDMQVLPIALVPRNPHSCVRMCAATRPLPKPQLAIYSLNQSRGFVGSGRSGSERAAVRWLCRPRQQSGCRQAWPTMPGASPRARRRRRRRHRRRWRWRSQRRLQRLSGSAATATVRQREERDVPPWKSHSAAQVVATNAGWGGVSAQVGQCKPARFSWPRWARPRAAAAGQSAAAAARSQPGRPQAPRRGARRTMCALKCRLL